MSDLAIRRATGADTDLIREILIEAAQWVRQLDGSDMWLEGELDRQHVQAEVESGMFVVAEMDRDVIGVIRFQLEDSFFWPDLETPDSAFVHRLGVRRSHAGRGVANALLQWAADAARALGKRYLRLDCDADRTRLRAMYERAGFRLHSYRQVGSYYVARYELKIQPPTSKTQARRRFIG